MYHHHHHHHQRQAQYRFAVASRWGRRLYWWGEPRQQRHPPTRCPRQRADGVAAVHHRVQPSPTSHHRARTRSPWVFTAAAASSASAVFIAADVMQYRIYARITHQNLTPARPLSSSSSLLYPPARNYLPPQLRYNIHIIYTYNTNILL